MRAYRASLVRDRPSKWQPHEVAQARETLADPDCEVWWLVAWAGHFPEDVLSSPALGLLSLSNPERWMHVTLTARQARTVWAFDALFAAHGVSSFRAFGDAVRAYVNERELDKDSARSLARLIEAVEGNGAVAGAPQERFSSVVFRIAQKAMGAGNHLVLFQAEVEALELALERTRQAIGQGAGR